jgi:inosose dehydratase
MSRSPQMSMSRRRFLQASAATLGIAGIAARFADNDDPFGGFKLGVQSYSFRRFKLDQALKRTHDLGLHYVEFYNAHVSPQSTPEQVQAVLNLCKEYQVTPLGFGVEHFSKDDDANKRLFDFGKTLGVKYLSASPDPDAFDSLDKLVDEYKIAIAIHPHGPVGRGRLDRWYSAEIIMKAVKDHHPLIGACIDTGHIIRAAILGKKLDPAQEIRIMGARNFGIHLKDNDNKTDTNVVIGKGVLDVPGVLKALKEVKFQGGLEIEYEAHEEEPSPDMKACVDVVKETVKNLG